MVVVRAVHGSVRVRFVPNPELTRRNWVGKKCTYRRPIGVIGSGGSDHQWVASGLVGVRSKKTVKQTQIRQRNANSGDSFPLDPARFRQIQQKSHRI